MKHTLSILAILLMAGAIQAQNYDFSVTAPTGQTLYYKIMTSNTVNVVYPNYNNGDYWSGYTKPTGTLTIPSLVTNSGTTYSVTSIASYAFYDCQSLEAVNMPTSLTAIGDYAFYNCSHLYHIVIPEGVTSVGASAYQNCSLSSDISLPNSLTSIGNQAFRSVSSVTSLTIPRNVQYIGAQAFLNCNQIDTLYFNADSCSMVEGSIASPFSTNISTLILGNHVKYIPNSAFYGLHITSVTLPNSVKSIGYQSFRNCTSLSSITFGTGIEIVCSYAFEGCSHLSAINLPNGIKSIESHAFSNLAQLTSITIPQSLEIIAPQAFHYCPNLTNVIFNADSCVITQNSNLTGVFSNCTHLTTATLGSNVKCIPGNLFSQCPITTVQIPNSVKYIGQYAFYGTLLQTVHFGNSVEAIEGSAFGACSQITSITFPNSLKLIGGDAFGGCTGLTSITIPQNVESVGVGAFLGCSNLDTLYLNADSCKAMGYYELSGLNMLSGPEYTGSAYSFRPAFQNLKKVFIGENVKSIPPTAFKDCQITEIVIPNSVKTIGIGAFIRCDSLVSITMGTGIDTINRFAFYGCSNLTSITLPNNLKYIGNRAFEYSGLTTISLPASVTAIGEYFIGNCDALTSIYSFATVPPTINQNTFRRSSGQPQPYTLPLYVPCTSLDIYQNNSHWSMFSNWNLISGNYSISIASANAEMGSAEYVTTDCESGNVTIVGVPTTHYRFAQWSDGNMDNPRSLTLNSDTALTAYFEPDIFIVTALPEIDTMGSVTGGGVYFNGDTVRLYAYPNGRNHFSHWGDNSIGNPFVAVVDGDTTITAFFAAPPRDTVIQIDTLIQVDTLEVHDTTTLIVHDTTIVHETTTLFVHDTTVIIDTMIAYLVHVGDTTFIAYNYNDTVFINNIYHDTVIINNLYHDTVYINNQYHDTVFINNYYHDSIFVTNYYHDTVFVTIYVYDSNEVAAMLTQYLDSLMSDSTYLDNHVLNELYAYIDAYLPDTVTVTDTITVVETLYVHDTIIVHDTIYVTEQGIGDIATINAKIYQRDGQLVVDGANGNTVTLYDAVGRQLAVRRGEYGDIRIDIPATGTYLVKVGDTPARRIVVVR